MPKADVELYALESINSSAKDMYHKNAKKLAKIANIQLLRF